MSIQKEVLPLGWEDTAAHLVITYLIHHGHHKTATLFADHAGVEIGADLDKVIQRRGVFRLIKSKKDR